MKNLSFLKGLVVGLGIAVVGGVVYANSISTGSISAETNSSWATIKDEIYFCKGWFNPTGDPARALCMRVTK
jgi:hypothetical protein